MMNFKLGPTTMLFALLCGCLAILATAQVDDDTATRRLNASAAMFDVIIRHGDVIDGTGRDRYRADIAVRDGVIVEIGELPDAKAHRVVDATGKLVTPGFIDLHSHAESGLVSDDPARRSAPNLITQGITTVVVNQDGGGPLDMAEQRTTMERLGVGLNVIQVIGHGTIREEVMGDDYQRPATADEMEQMQQHLRTALTDGAFGMSAGLEYDPGRWSTPREMEALAKTVASADGVYIVHERSSGSRPMWYIPSRDPADQPSMIDNLQELIQIAAKTKVTTVATHIKARGVDYWGSAQRMNDLIQKARDSGLPLYADQYPYNT
ncbi:MAG TPA: amidohydrolase family protein, partial [Pirellulaceae bacterium]|nr:amidohydrolase family protein [Pirellulaceae bacterium]